MKFELGMWRQALSIDDATATALGRHVAAFAALDAGVCHVIGRLLNDEDDKLGRIACAQMNFTAKLDLLGSLYRHRFNDDEQRKLVDDIVARCRRANEERNELIHADWLPTDEGLHTITVRARAKKGLEIQVDPMPLVEIEKRTVLVQELAGDFMLLNHYVDAFSVFGESPDLEIKVSAWTPRQKK